MSYPSKLLPKRFFKFINLDRLAHLNVYLIRHTRDKQIVDPQSQEIKLEYICEPRKNMDDLSLNFYGKFKETEAEIEVSHLTEFYLCQWKIFRSGRKPQPSHFRHDASRGWFYVQLSKLHNILLPNYNISSQISHKPLACNFWHVQLEWKDSNGRIISRQNKEWSRPIQTATRVLVRNAASLAIHQPKEIPFRYYFIFSLD